MPPRSRRTGATPIDLEDLRSRLAEGRQARVQVAASAQFPDGATGLVRRIGDPAVDGEEFVFVAVSVGGAKDLLPFAPSDLSAPGSARPVPAPVAGRRRAAAAPTAAAGRSFPAGTVGQVSSTGRPRGVAAGDTPRVPVVAAPTTAEPTPGPTVGGTAGPPTPAAGKPSRSPSRARRAPVTITIATDGGHGDPWRIEAKVGARTAVKPTIVSPSRVWEVVSSLGDAQLSEVVGSLLAEHRRATESRVNQLAAELAALEAELHALPDQPRS